jgi:hypothetical protein
MTSRVHVRNDGLGEIAQLRWKFPCSAKALSAHGFALGCIGSIATILKSRSALGSLEADSVLLRGNSGFASTVRVPGVTRSSLTSSVESWQKDFDGCASAGLRPFGTVRVWERKHREVLS